MKRDLTFILKESQDALITDLQTVHPHLIIVLGWTLNFCQISKLPCIITNIVTTYPGSQSTSHNDGRAFDMSLRGWKTEDVDAFKDYMKRNTGHLGAYSSSDLKQRLVVVHDLGFGKHMHVQVHK